MANITLNELDWWVDSQWVGLPTRYKYAYDKNSQHGKYTALKCTKLKEVYIVRYADDFKIFCRNRNAAKRMYEATKKWLKERLRLDINEGKSGIINFRNRYSEFLGIKLKLRRKGRTRQGNHNYVIKSHIGDKAQLNILENIKTHVKRMQKPKGEAFKAVRAYNVYVLGVHNYFNAATRCYQDLSKIAYQSYRTFKKRLNPRKRKSGEKLYGLIADRYVETSQLRFVYDMPIIPVGYLHYLRLSQYNGLSMFIANEREKVHRKQQAVNMTVLKYIMQNPIRGQSVEYNDNRISLYVAQFGKCYVTGEELWFDVIHCHHKRPKAKGGTDEYANLVILHEDVHRLIHATDDHIIEKYLSKLKLDKEQLKRLNKLRKLAELKPVK